MATLISSSTGNWTGSTTFSVADTASGALQLARNAESSLAASGTADLSPLFTITNGAVIDGVLLWIRGGTSGTIKFDLQKSGVSQASVTVNKTDLPSGSLTLAVPMFFKFTSTAVGDGTANWKIVYTTTGGGGSGTPFVLNGSSGGVTRALRTTTTAVPAATDNIIVVGEVTGAATTNLFTVTMNSVTATVYGSGTLNTGAVAGGGVYVGVYGTLSYGTAASTNYYLRINGYILLFSGGTLNIGSPGAEIPRNSTAVLEFQNNTLDGDFGVYAYEYSTVNIAGLSRTSGKNIVKCKLTSNYTTANIYDQGPNPTNGTIGSGGPEASGNSMIAGSFVDNTTSGPHYAYLTHLGAVPDNTFLTASIWLGRGSGLNNRYVRLTMGNTNNLASVVKGFYVDVDLQAGTVGTLTAIGIGTATSVSITPGVTGFIIRMTGKMGNTAGLTANTLFLSSCSAPGTTTYVGNTTQCFLYSNQAIVSASSISDITFNVDTDTGWLANDAFCVAATSRSYTDCGIFPLNANAGASSLSTALYSNANYSGTYPTQAEIGLLTRNVKIRSSSPTLMTFLYFTALSTANVSWAEFYYVGMSSLNRYGISVDAGAVANPKSFTYCSIHDCDSNGVVLANNAAAASLNTVFSNNIMWINYASHFVHLLYAITNNDYTIDNNLTMRLSFSNNSGYYLVDVGGTITNNTVAGGPGSNSHGFIFAVTSGETIGTFSGNSAHAVGGSALTFLSAVVGGVIDNFTGWRCGTTGVNNNSADLTNIVFNDLVLYGNVNGVFLTANANNLNITGDSVIAGETGYTSTYGIALAIATPVYFDVSGVDFVGSTLLPSPVAHTISDLYFITAATFAPFGHFNDGKFNTNVINSKAAWMEGSYLNFERFGQVNGEHRTETPYGRIVSDNVLYNSSSRSMRMSPLSTTKKLEQTPDGRGIRVTVNSGYAVTASVWVRKDAVYSGNQPRLVVRSNPLMGITSDTVLATCSDVTSSSSFPTWDATTAINVGLSGGNLVLLNDGGVDQNNQGIRVSSAYEKTEGKFYFENTLTTRVGGTSVGFGIGVVGSTYPNMGGGNALVGTMTYIGGQVASNGASLGNLLGARASGDVWGGAFDLGNRKAWFRATVGGVATGWTTGGDPVLGTGGTTIPAGAMVPFATFGGSGNSSNNRFTTNFGSSAFATACPAGFIAGWGIPSGAVGTSTWVQLSGTTTIVTDDGVLEFAVDCDGGGYINVDDWSFA